MHLSSRVHHVHCDIGCTKDKVKPPLKKEGALLTSKHEDCQRHARSFILALFAAVIGPGRNVRSVVHCKSRIRTSFMPSSLPSLPLKRSIQLVRKTPWPTDFLASHRRPLALHASERRCCTPPGGPGGQLHRIFSARLRLARLPLFFCEMKSFPPPSVRARPSSVCEVLPHYTSSLSLSFSLARRGA